MKLTKGLISGLLITLLLSGCGANWGWYVVSPSTESGRSNLTFLIDGLGYTIALSICAIVISIVIGLLIALPGLAKGRAPRTMNRVYGEWITAIDPVLAPGEISNHEPIKCADYIHTVYQKSFAYRQKN